MNDQMEKLNKWICQPDMDPDIKEELIQLKEKNDTKEITDRFYREMTFGTGGLRGKLGAGTNRMNILTVRRVSQAFARYLLDHYEKPSVVIAHDNRLNSELFTFEAACVFSANDIKVSLFDKLTPTPMLSYAVRKTKADGGVVITASHNPKEYSGYKIYDGEGCQCLPEEAEEVSGIMENIDIFTDIKTIASEFRGKDPDERIEDAVTHSKSINYIPEYVNGDYYEEILNTKMLLGDISNVSAVFTPLNGTGAVPVVKVLNDAGIGHLYTVEEQMDPDPNFTSCPSPNPEEDEALEKGIELCEKLKNEYNEPDLLLATDPDCDRVGVMVRDSDKYVRIDGNQTGVLLFDFILNRRKSMKDLPSKPLLITTVVSTPLAGAIAGKNKVHTDSVLTGFKYIGDKIAQYEKKGQKDRFIFGFEESCGYLAGTYVRDKDAVSASLLISEMTGYYKKQGKTLVDRMNELYSEYGYYITGQKSFEAPGREGLKRIDRIMHMLRKPEMLTRFSFKTVEYIDYENQSKRRMGLYDDDESGCAMAVGTKPILNLPKENMLEFNFSNHCRAIIRPSGTEPKIKIYFAAKGKTRIEAELLMDIITSEFVDLVESL